MTGRLPRGVFISLEGGDGSGKSTQAAALADLLRGEGYPVLLTEEPGGTALGRAVKGFFQQQAASGSAALTPAAEVFLFEAARAQHVDEAIRPALARHEVVLCDRFTDSTVAYQGYGRGLSVEWIVECNRMAAAGLQPDLTLLLDAPPEVALGRAQEDEGGDSGRVRDAIGAESLAFHQRVREGFLELAKREPERIAVLDASLPAGEVTKTAWARVQAFLSRLRPG